MAEDPHRKLVPAVQNATAILRLLARRGAPMGATQIAREAGLSVSSAFNIPRTLAAERLLSFDPEAKSYRLGLGMLEVAVPLIGADPGALVRPLLTRIAVDHQVMIALWQVTDRRIVLIDRVTAPRIVQAVIARNSRLPVFAGALGRCYAAAAGLDAAAIRAGYDGVRWQAAPGIDAYQADVAAARETRRARDRGNLFRGLEIVAALARDGAGTPRLGLSSITIAGQHDEAGLERVGGALVAAADRIESGLFGRRHAV